MLTGGGLSVLLDVAALTDEVVLGLGAGEAALGLGPELGSEARHSASDLALGNHCGGGGFDGDELRGCVVVVIQSRSGSFQSKQR